MTDDTTPTTRDITHEQGQPRLPADGDGPTDTPLGPGPVGPSRPRLGPEEWRATQDIATGLGETERAALGQVGRVVGRLGAERARAFLARTQDIEAAGGLMLPDGSRRRTPGGTFFHLVRTSDEVSREDRTSIFPPLSKRPKKTAGGNASATPALAGATAPTPAAWTDDIYREMMAALQQEPGRATTVKITVIGRPGTAVEQGQAIVLALVSEKVPDLPKGLPAPPDGTRYTVFVARKQWAKVAEALAADPEDAAIIEGYAALDPRVEGIAVYATSATTKRTQAAKRATQPATTPWGRASGARPPVTHEPDGYEHRTRALHVVRWLQRVCAEVLQWTIPLCHKVVIAPGRKSRRLSSGLPT